MESLSEFGLCKKPAQYRPLLCPLLRTYYSPFWLKFRQVGNTCVKSRSHFYGYGCQDPPGPARTPQPDKINYDHDHFILSLKKR
jgi:hypothetical protein